MKLIYIILIFLLLILVILFISKSSTDTFTMFSDNDKLLHQCFPNYKNNSFNKHHNKNYYRDDHNNIIGIIFDTDNKFIKDSPKLPNKGLHLSYFCVDKSKRNMGLGTKILHDMELKALSHNYDYLIMLVKDSNKKAIDLYSRLGYSKYNHTRQSYSDGYKASYYIKYL